MLKENKDSSSSLNLDLKTLSLKILESSDHKEIIKNKKFLSHFNIEYLKDNDESQIINDLKIINDMKKNNRVIDTDLIFNKTDANLAFLRVILLNNEIFLSDIVSSIESFNLKIADIRAFDNSGLEQNRAKDSSRVRDDDAVRPDGTAQAKAKCAFERQNRANATAQAKCDDDSQSVCDHVSESESDGECQNEKIKILSFKITGISFDSLLRDFDQKRKNFFESFYAVLNGESDSLICNSLSIKFGLDVRNIKLLSAVFAYLKQIYPSFDLIFMKNLVENYSQIFISFTTFFDLRLNPKKNHLNEIIKLKENINTHINEAKSINEFNVLKKIFEIICAISRTNFFQNKDYISFKVKSSLISGIRNEGVFAEIFVYHENIEGVHLRGGKIARGGFRWSDRVQDYRIEAFDLMKAQVKKNSIITPTGAKAAFIIKNAEKNSSNKNYVTESYQIFIRGLLDITDNLDSKGGLIRPSGVVIPKDFSKGILAQEAYEPYIVAAADKGTGTFSDYANQVSNEYNFWLGDAFASGGSNGYDHKALSITSRGMWVSVERLFGELNKNVKKESISVVGIGDMAGDVFGNGMLLSRKIKLIAAFNHVNIFIDPTPDEESSYEERKRLFKKPRSTWEDYDASLISKGGGIFKRSEKSIKISAEAARALGINATANLEFTPNELISHILKSKVDLLFNGGIGTFVKSSFESNEEVFDRNNDCIRINGCDLRVLVVAEGGNLGFTQKGRVEYARFGGRLSSADSTNPSGFGGATGGEKRVAKINTDFIDNSAGVSCSDREVNIKIALQSSLLKGKITLQERNEFLKMMEEEVCNLVLRDNLLQNNALMIEEFRSVKNITWHHYLVQKLEKNHVLNREFESVLTDKDFEELENSGGHLTRPELCILLSYSKIWLKNELLNSDIPSNKYFEKFLIGYFPKIMQERFREEILSHPLKDEIITNYIVNTMINRIGVNFVLNLMEKSGTSISEIIYAYFIVRDSFRLRDIWHDVEYNYEFPTNQAKIFTLLEIKKYSNYIISRFLRIPGYNLADLQKNILELSEKTTYALENFENLVSKKGLLYYKKKCSEYKKNVFEEECLTLLAKISGLVFIPSIINISRKYNVNFDFLIRLYFLIEDKLDSRILRKKISSFKHFGGLYDEISISILIDDIGGEHNHIMEFILVRYAEHLTEEEVTPDEILQIWSKNFHELIENYLKIKQKTLNSNEFDYSLIILLLNRIKLLHD